MATLKLDLSNLSVVGTSGSEKFYIIDANKTKLKYAGYKVEAISDKKVTFADGSTLTLKEDGKLVFTAASGTGTFDASELGTEDFNSAKNTVISQVTAVLNSAAVTGAATVEAAKDVLKKEAAKYEANTLNYAVYKAAIDAFIGDDVERAVSAAASAAKVPENTNFAEINNITELNFSEAGAVTVTKELENLTKLTGSSYADKLTVASTVVAGINVDAGEGNDVVKITDGAKKAAVTLGDGDDVLNIVGASTVDASVVLGDGKDVVNVASADATLAISDYNYADGDKINLTYTTASADIATVNYAGSAPVTVGNVTVTVTASDNVGAFDLTYNGKDTTTFFAATDTTKAKEVEINAKGISNKVNIDTTNSKLANITLGSGESNVVLKNGTDKDVIDATGASKVTVTNFKNADDTLILDGANLTNIKLANNNATVNTDLTYGKTSITLAGITKTATLNLNDSKLAYDLDATGQTLAAGADMYYGNEDKKTVVETVDNVHLTEVDKYKNIYNVSVASTGVEADKLDLSGFTTSGTTGINIDASQSDVAVNVWAYNKNIKATDTITLSNSNNKQDTVSFVSNDGKVSVANFGFGTGEESDILYLRDTEDLQKLAVKSGVMKLGKSQLTVDSSAGATDLMQVKLADDTTSLVAGNFSTVNANKVSVDLTSTQAVDFYALTGTKNTLTVTNNAFLDDAVNFRYSNLDANHTTGNQVKDITVSGFNNEDDEVTVGAVAKVDVTGVNSGKTHIWVHGIAESGTVDLTGNGSKDQIDFVSGIDKKVTVTGYDAAGEDTIYLRGAEDLKAVTAGYKFEEKNGGIQITGVDNAASKLVLDSVTGDLNLKTLNGSSLKAIVSKADATFSTDTQIYAGMAKIVADMSTEGDVAVRIGTKGEIGVDSSEYCYIGNSVKEFDGSNSNAVFHLAGSSTAATTLRGGNTQNSFYGGGSSNDKMVGNVSAVDTFYFGKGEGKDTIEEADGNDTVCLLGVVDLTEISVDTKKNVISIGANDTLTFGQGAEEALTAGELTFSINGSNYVCKDGKFVAKEA